MKFNQIVYFALWAIAGAIYGIFCYFPITVETWLRELVLLVVAASVAVVAIAYLKMGDAWEED